MPDSAQRLFPCTVLPDTPFGAQAKAHVLAIAVSGILSLIVARSKDLAVVLEVMGVAVLLSAWNFRPWGRNRVVRFFERLEFHLGNDSPPGAISPAGPCSLSVLVTLLLAFPVAPPVRAISLYILLFAALFVRGRRSHTSIGEIFSMANLAVFAFLAYPDNSYVAPAGTKAVWIPKSRISSRIFRFSIFLVPFYLSLLTGNLIAEISFGQTLQAVLADLVLLVPIPFLVMVVLLAKPLCHLKTHLKPGLSPGGTEWDQCVERVRNSMHVADGVRMADHIFLGYVLPTREEAWHPLRQIGAMDLPCRTPALVHEAGASSAHIHLEGPTGVNKTTIGQINYAVQFIRGKYVPVMDVSGNGVLGIDGEPLWRKSDPVPLLFLDLKGDPAFFNTIREECERRGQKFHFFTPELGKATSYFNPITNLHSKKRHVIEFCEIVLNAMDLWHGDLSYGTSYFAEQCRNLLLKTLLSAPTITDNWESLYELLAQTLDRREHKDVFELLGRIFALAQYPTLGPAPAGVDSVHMPTLFEKNECAYFWLPAMDSAMSVITMAKFALFSYLSAAKEWNNSGKPVKPGVCSIDEMQVVCGQNTERIFQQASGSKVRLIVSNQSLSNLDTRDAPNLGKTIWTNTHVKQAFGLVDVREGRDWIDLSGETQSIVPTVHVGVDGEGRRTSGTSYQPVLHSRLNQNVINAVNNTPGSSLLYILRDNGLCRFEGIPRQIWCPYPMSIEEYNRRASTPWPDLPETKIISGQVQTTVVNAQSPKSIEQQAVNQYAALESLFRQASKQSGRRVSASVTDV